MLKVIVYLAKLIEDKPLPKEALDHPLKGEYKDCREFHISGDLLVIYFIIDDTLNLIRIGSHS
jgi:mRNA interferase YafQ